MPGKKAFPPRPAESATHRKNAVAVCAKAIAADTRLHVTMMRHIHSFAPTRCKSRLLGTSKIA